MTKLSSKILQKIRNEKMTPRPRWYFMLIQILLGTAVLTSIVVGSLAVAIVIRHFTLTDWELADLSAGGHLLSVIFIIPYIWIILIGLIILLAEILIKHIKKCHRIKSWQLVAASILLSVICGSLFFFIEIDEPFEAGLRNNFPPYQQWEKMRNGMFAAPEQGVLAGEITKINPDEEWIVIDFRNKEWFVDISKAAMRDDILFEIGTRVGIIGEPIEDNFFRADIVRPWKKGTMLPAPRPQGMIMIINERKIVE